MIFKRNPSMRWPAALALLMGAWLAPAQAAAGQPGEAVERWPLLALGLVLTLLGAALSRLRRMWHELGPGQRAQRVFGLALIALGLFGVAFGATEAPPGRAMAQGQAQAQAGQGAVWLDSYELARQRAQALGRPVLLDFTAEWCNACHELEAEVFAKPEVRARLGQEFVLLKVDFDRQTPENMALLSRFEVSGLPRVAFEGAQGELLRGAWFEGKLDVPSFLSKLDAALAGAQQAGRSEFERTLGERGLLAALLLVFLAGVLSSLTPCVYPLIPITIGLFGARQAKTRREGFLLSVTYVAGIAITYSLMGLFAATFGTLFGGLMQSPWVLGALSLLFVALGLGSLGVFQVRLPGALQERLSHQGGAGYAGALMMGLVAGVIAAPCIGPIVAGVLLYVARQQDLLLGWLMMTAFALGMGLLFIVLGTFSSLLGKLPRSGAWMDGVKTFFGALFFAMALYYLRYLVKPLGELTRAIWVALAG